MSNKFPDIENRDRKYKSSYKKYFPVQDKETFPKVKTVWGIDNSLKATRRFKNWASGEGLNIASGFRTISKSITILPEVEAIILKKKEIVEGILNGIITKEDIKETTLRSLFRLQEQSELINLSSIKALKEKMFKKGEIMLKVKNGTLKADDLQTIKELFDPCDYYKIIVYFNNKMGKKRSPEKKIPEEDEKIKELKEGLKKFHKNKEILKGYLVFFERLKDNNNKYKSSAEFLLDLKKMGLFDWYDKTVDWRSQPYVLKFAVGENEEIASPFSSHNGKYIDTYNIKYTGERLIKYFQKKLKDYSCQKVNVGIGFEGKVSVTPITFEYYSSL